MARIVVTAAALVVLASVLAMLAVGALLFHGFASPLAADCFVQAGITDGRPYLDICE